MSVLKFVISRCKNDVVGTGQNKLFIYYQVPSFEIQADIFMSLEGIRRAFRRVKYRKTSKNISLYFKRRHLIIYLLSNSKNFTPGVKILEFRSNRGHQDFPKSKIYTNHDIFIIKSQNLKMRGVKI